MKRMLWKRTFRRTGRTAIVVAFGILFPVMAGAAEVPSTADLTLDKGIEIALSRHPLLLEKGADVDAAKARVGIATAPYYPRMDASAGYERFEHPAVFFRPSGGGAQGLGDTIGPMDDFTARLEARWTMWDGGARRAERDASVARAEGAVADKEAARQGVIYRVREAFFDHVTARRLEEVGLKSLSRAEKHLAFSKERYRAGTVPKEDVLKAQVELADANLSLVSARSAVRSTLARLNTAMGIPAETGTTVVPPRDSLVSPDTMQLSAALSGAESRRPELKTILANVVASDAVIRKAKAAFLPQVGVSGMVGVRDTDFPPEEKDWSAGVKVTWPLFTGFARGHERDLAKAESEKAKARFQEVSNRIREEVVVAHSGLRETFEAVHAAEVLVADAKESLRLAEERYANGIGTILDLLDAQVSLTRAEAKVVEATLSHQSAYSRFLLVTGSL
jgi:outer membrane protein TolC